MNRKRDSVTAILRDAILLAGVVAGFSCCGCSKEKDWYDYSKEWDEMKDARIDELMTTTGADPVEASKRWNLEFSIQQTEGRRGQVALEGQDLDRTMATEP